MFIQHESIFPNLTMEIYEEFWNNRGVKAAAAVLDIPKIKHEYECGKREFIFWVNSHKLAWVTSAEMRRNYEKNDDDYLYLTVENIIREVQLRRIDI